MIFQAYNKRIGAWVKYGVTKNRSRILNVKQANPKTKFKGIVIKKAKK